MSDHLNHECGIAMVRLLKPLSFYHKKYGTSFYGLQKLYLLMEKQHNRGQDGAGVVSLKLDLEPGTNYIHRHRSADASAINDVFSRIYNHYREVELKNPSLINDPLWVKANLPFAAEIYLGHLRY